LNTESSYVDVTKNLEHCILHIDIMWKEVTHHHMCNVTYKGNSAVIKSKL